MGLADRLQDEYINSRAGLPCRIGSLLRGKELSDKDKEYLQKVLDTPATDPTRIPTTAIAEALKQEGYPVGIAAITRHRRGACRCYGANPKFSD